MVIEDPPANRVVLLGLTVRCPYDQGFPERCPLAPIRRRPFEERVDWVDSLFDEEVDAIVANHRLCLERKIADGS